MKESAREMFERMRLDPDGWFLCRITYDQNLPTKPGDLRLEIPTKISPVISDCTMPMLNLYFMHVKAVKPYLYHSDKGQSWLITTNLDNEWLVFEKERPNPVVSSRSDALDFVYNKIKSLFRKYDVQNIMQTIDLSLSIHGIL